MFKNIEWKTPEKKVPMVVLGREVLEAIECDNRRLLEAASGWNNWEIDVANDPKEEWNNKEETRRIAAF